MQKIMSSDIDCGGDIKMQTPTLNFQIINTDKFFHETSVSMEYFDLDII